MGVPSLAAEVRVSGLAIKMAQVMSEIGRIPKRGYNDFHGYEYPLEADILDAIRDKLAERNVMWFPSVESVTREGTLTTLIGKVTFVDAETGEERTVGMVGTGDDKGDKGVYKAYTGAVKYCLLKTFMISTGDDPENEGQGTREAGRQAQGRGRAGSGGARPSGAGRAQNGGAAVSAKPSSVATKAQIKAVYDFGKNQLGLTDETLGVLLQEVRGKQTTEGITVMELDQWKEKMEGAVVGAM